MRFGNFPLTLAFVLCLSFSFAGCGGGGGGAGAGIVTATGDGSGKAVIIITDAPIDNFSEVWLTVNDVFLLDAAEVAVRVFNGELRLNLLDLFEISEILSAEDVPPGRYSKIRLQVTDPLFVLENGEEIHADRIDVHAGGMVDLNPQEPFDIEEGGNVVVAIDFDIANSIEINEANGRYALNPQVFVDIHDDEDDPIEIELRAVTGAIAEKAGDESAFVLIVRHDEDDVEDVGRLLVLCDGDTEYMDRQGEPIDFADLPIEGIVEVKGVLNEDGNVLARQVRLMWEDIDDPDRFNHLEIQGWITATADCADPGCLRLVTVDHFAKRDEVLMKSMVGNADIAEVEAVVVAVMVDTKIVNEKFDELDSNDLVRGQRVGVEGVWDEENDRLTASFIKVHHFDLEGIVSEIDEILDRVRLTTQEEGRIIDVWVYVTEDTEIVDEEGAFEEGAFVEARVVHAKVGGIIRLVALLIRVEVDDEDPDNAGNDIEDDEFIEIGTILQIREAAVEWALFEIVLGELERGDREAIELLVVEETVVVNGELQHLDLEDLAEGQRIMVRGHIDEETEEWVADLIHIKGNPLQGEIIAAFPDHNKFKIENEDGHTFIHYNDGTEIEGGGFDDLIVGAHVLAACILVGDGEIRMLLAREIVILEEGEEPEEPVEFEGAFHIFQILVHDKAAWKSYEHGGDRAIVKQLRCYADGDWGGDIIDIYVNNDTFVHNVQREALSMHDLHPGEKIGVADVFDGEERRIALFVQIHFWEFEGEIVLLNEEHGKIKISAGGEHIWAYYTDETEIINGPLAAPRGAGFFAYFDVVEGVKKLFLSRISLEEAPPPENREFEGDFYIRDIVEGEGGDITLRLECYRANHHDEEFFIYVLDNCVVKNSLGEVLSQEDLHAVEKIRVAGIAAEDEKHYASFIKIYWWDFRSTILSIDGEHDRLLVTAPWNAEHEMWLYMRDRMEVIDGPIAEGAAAFKVHFDIVEGDKLLYIDIVKMLAD